MVDQKLREMLKGDYSIFESDSCPDKIPDRLSIRGLDICVDCGKNSFRFGSVNCFSWFEGSFLYPQYTSQDLEAGTFFYIPGAEPKEPLNLLKERLVESIWVNYDSPCVVTSPTFTTDLEFYLTLADQKMKKYIPSDMEVEQLITVLNNEKGRFLDQIIAIELLSNTRNRQAYNQLKDIVKYQVILESGSERRVLSPCDHGSRKYFKKWGDSGSMGNDGELRVEFVNINGELKKVLAKPHTPSWSYDYSSTPPKVLPYCTFLHIDFIDLYNFIFNAFTKIRGNFGERVGREEELEKMRFDRAGGKTGNA